MEVKTEVQPLFITTDRLKEWSACADGRKWFSAAFPQGGAYGEVQTALRAKKRGDYSRWLTDAAFNSLLNEPSATAQITADFKAESDAVIAETANVKPDAETGCIGSSGGYARIGSSGGYAQIGSSGGYAQIGSSGVSARIGSSGDSARIGSSGGYARINAEGAGSVIASSGLSARVRAGEFGAVAVAYHDGTRTRFAVGYVGENIKALTWYSVNAAGEFVEVSQ
jgi:hypothetical protein